MASIVLASSNHASFASSIWSDWARSPYDLLLVAEDGMIEAHSGMFFPMSRYLAAVVETLPFTGGPTQVVLTGTTIKAVSAVKELVYKGACCMDGLILPEILGTLGTLGIEVSNNSFKTESTDKERGNLPRSEIQDFGVMTEAANEASNDVTERIKE